MKINKLSLALNVFFIIVVVYLVLSLFLQKNSLTIINASNKEIEMVDVRISGKNYSYMWTAKRIVSARDIDFVVKQFAADENTLMVDIPIFE